jgi:hypothetical protein
MNVIWAQEWASSLRVEIIAIVIVKLLVSDAVQKTILMLMSE